MTIKHFDQDLCETAKKMETAILYLAMVKKQSFLPEKIEYVCEKEKYTIK